ncbi:p450 domain-containing protein [Cephalotus follicularis]|uniref:p450 domain-containing protein n=1 Tax=Cephalotus follicularis TaxID=3775 RepID=A0A1Q3CKP1_CEPFO|nr:p450 domain-containing protein [Cephalotus follicularis]
MIFELTTLSILLALLGAAIFTYKTKPNLPPSPFALPIIGHLHLLGPLIHHSFHQLSSQYGPLIHLRLGSVPCVVASTPELAKQLLKTNELKFTARKHSIAIDYLTYNNSSFAFAPYGPYWKFVKKMCMGELLGNRTLNNFVPIRTEEYHMFLGLLAKKSETNEAVNMTEELIKMVNNIISRMMLGLRFSGTEGQTAEARTVIREVTQIFGEFNVSDFVWFCKNLDLQGFGKRMREIHRRYDALLEKIIKDKEETRNNNEKENSCDNVKDFLDMFLDAAEDKDSEIKLTRSHIKAMILDFFTAATDTTAITLEWALAELINHPNVFNKAREEIENVIGNSRLVNESDCPNLPYIQAIIKETFRLHPPIPMIARKSTEKCNIDKYVIPSQTLLFVNMWAIGRDPEIWKNPLDFMPERFLSFDHGDPLGLVDVKGQHFQLLPFGTGRRGCPGISLALQELPAVLASLIQCFDWKVVTSVGKEMNGRACVVDMTERPGLTAPRANDLICVPTARFGPVKSLVKE